MAIRAYIEETKSIITVDGMKTLSSLACLFTGIIESHEKFLICGGIYTKNTSTKPIHAGLN